MDYHLQVATKTIKITSGRIRAIKSHWLASD
jgi:hypothetical protein